MQCPKCKSDNPGESVFCAKCGTQIRESEEKPLPTETIEAPKEELTTGSTFAGRYQIIEELGRGGMGRVYKAIDKEIDTRVALKLIKPEIAADKKTIERFRNELKTARDISHKNVCRMYDLNKEEEAFYITMEYISGEDLKSFIRRAAPLSTARTVSIAKQVCEGLAEAHRLGVVHRDLKPGNIMIDKEGNVRLMDFGIARSLKTKGITGPGVMIGTPEYMSPEQVEGMEVDKRSDIYSLGVILYEMVTGQVPFEGDTPFTIGVKHKSEAPKDPKEINEQIPEDLSHVILKCLEKDKEKRHENAEKLLSELNKIGIGKPETKVTDETKWQNSIAVLPFVDLSPNKDQEYFCDGMAEELINALTKIERLQVASRTSAFQFKGQSQDICDIGKKLQVNTLLEGSVRKAGNRIRVTAQLINVDSGYHLWAEKYDRDMEDIFAIQDEISLAIVDKLKVRLLGREKKMLVKRPTENLDAYNLYLQGRYFWNRRYEGGLQNSMAYFQQAIEKDPHFVLAYVGMADAFSLLGTYGFLPPNDAFPKAKAAAHKALELDDSLPEVHTTLGYISSFYDCDWEAGDREFRKALEYNPNDALTHIWYALHMVTVGRSDEGVAEAERAQELDPVSSIINSLYGLIYVWARRYDEGAEHLKKTIEMDPTFLFSYVWLTNAYCMKALYEEAVEEIKKALAFDKDMAYALGHLGWVYGIMDKKNEASKVLNQLNELSKKKYVAPWTKMMVSIGLGDMDKIFEYCEESYSERDPAFIMTIKIGPWYDILRSDPRYTALMKKMGLEK